MSSAILIHGWTNKGEYYNPDRPTPSNDHWFPWLTKQLVLNDIDTVSIEMPNSYYPEYSVWKRELERYDIDENTILVGHSCGGGFLVRWLSETNKRVDKVILVAPWLGYDVGDEPFDESFFDFEIDPKLLTKANKIAILVSDDDLESIHKSVVDIQNVLPTVSIRRFVDKGHFTIGSLGGEAFPELLKEVIK